MALSAQTRTPFLRSWLLSVPVILWAGALAAHAAGAGTVLLTRGFGGGPPMTGAAAFYPAVSADGRFVAFTSDATNYAPVFPGSVNVFVRDRLSDTVDLVSQSSAGAPGDRYSIAPAISADGRFVAYWSDADNLVPGDSNGAADVFVRDRLTQTTERVSIATDGTQSENDYLNAFAGLPALAISPDGRFVAFQSLSGNLAPNGGTYQSDVYLRDRLFASTERISVDANGNAAGDSGYTGVALSADGRYVAFTSYADHLVPDDTNGTVDVFVRDRALGVTEQVDVSSAGVEPTFSYTTSPTISADGRYVAFSAAADNLLGANTFVQGIVLRYRQDGKTLQVDLAANGAPSDSFSQFPVITPDGQHLLFTSTASNLGAPPSATQNGALYVSDLATGMVHWANPGPGGGTGDRAIDNYDTAALSADGQKVVFTSFATNLVSGDTDGQPDVFVYDRQATATERGSQGAAGAEGVTGPHTSAVAMTPDGRFVAFQSDAFNLVADDNNQIEDVFVWDRLDGSIERVNLAQDGSPETWTPSAEDHSTVGISADGRFIVFSSAAKLTSFDPRGTVQCYLRDRLTHTTTLVSDRAGGVAAAFADEPTLSADGRVIAFVGYGFLDDPVSSPQIYTRYLATGITELISQDVTGRPGDYLSLQPSLNEDGRFVAFTSYADYLLPGLITPAYEIFVRDRASRRTELVSITRHGTAATSFSYAPSLSADGRMVAFQSDDSELVPSQQSGGSGVYVRDRAHHTTARVDAPPSDNYAYAYAPAISADGRTVAFYSDSPVLVTGDMNQSVDTFVRDLATHALTRVSVTTDGSEEAPYLGYPSYLAISNGGRFIAFESGSPNLTAETGNGNYALLLRDAGGADALGRLVAPSRLDLGTARVHGARTGRLLLHNASSTTPLLVSLEVTDGPFSLPYESSAVLRPHGSAAFVVAFQPTTAGHLTGSLTVHSTDPSHASLAVSLSGDAR